MAVRLKVIRRNNEMEIYICTRGCIQKFPDWPPGARTANDTALCYYVQL